MAVLPPQKFGLTLDLEMSTSSAFSALLFAVQLPVVQASNTAFGLTKLAAAETETAQRQQKAANTSLLESRSLLQTATLVFPWPIVCSRLSNHINILAKKFFRPPTGPRPPPGSATEGQNKATNADTYTLQISRSDGHDRHSWLEFVQFSKLLLCLQYCPIWHMVQCYVTAV